MNFLLSVAGYTVWTATDGEQALKILQRQTPTLILSDIDMPKVDGYELLRRLRANPQWCYLPFVFMSDKYSLNDFMYALDLGADEYLPKPFNFDDLLFTIETTLETAHARMEEPLVQSA